MPSGALGVLISDCDTFQRLCGSVMILQFFVLYFVDFNRFKLVRHDILRLHAKLLKITWSSNVPPVNAPRKRRVGWGNQAMTSQDVYALAALIVARLTACSNNIIN